MLWGLGVAGIKRWRIDDQTATSSREMLMGVMYH